MKLKITIIFLILMFLISSVYAEVSSNPDTGLFYNGTATNYTAGTAHPDWTANTHVVDFPSATNKSINITGATQLSEATGIRYPNSTGTEFNWTIAFNIWFNNTEDSQQVYTMRINSSANSTAATTDYVRFGILNNNLTYYPNCDGQGNPLNLTLLSINTWYSIEIKHLTNDTNNKTIVVNGADGIVVPKSLSCSADYDYARIEPNAKADYLINDLRIINDTFGFEGEEGDAPVITFIYPTQNQVFSNAPIYDGWINFTTNENANCTTNRTTEWFKNETITNSTHKFFFNNITIPFSDGDQSINVSCWDSDNNNGTTTLVFSLDLTDPTITLNQPTGFNISNQSTINQYLDELPLNITFTDERDLFAYSVNITRAGTIFFNETNESISPLLQSNLTRNINISTWGEGIYDIEIMVSDSHTKKSIGDYGIDKFGNRITFNTEEQNEIILKSSGAYSTDYEKKKDKYAFGFNYLLSGTSRTFTIESNNEIRYLPGTGFNAHFVVWNSATRKGNWVDFEGIGNNFTVNKISDYKYEVIFYGLPKEKSVILNSIGGTNVVTENYQWYRGKATETFTSIATVSTEQSFYLNVTRLSGFVDEVNATFAYNGTQRLIERTESSNSIIFTSTFVIPSVETTYNITWNVSVTQNSTKIHNFSINATQTALLAIFNLSIFDEENLTLLVGENITLFLTLNNTLQISTDTGLVIVGNLSVGEYRIEAESPNYPRRGIFFTIANQSTNVDLYLVKDETGNEFIDFFIFDTGEIPIDDVRMTFQKRINTTFVTVAQFETDFAGQGRVFLDQQNEYRIIFSHQRFPTKTISLLPLKTEYSIFLEQIPDSLYVNVWEGIRYTLFPKARILNVSTTPYEIGIDIFADDSTLQHFGVFIDGTNFTCVPANCISNITGSPAGGIASVTILANTTGTFDVHYFFKRSGFEIQFIHGTLYGAAIIKELFGENFGNWLESLVDNLGGKDASRPMLSVLAAVAITILCVVAAQIGILGIPLVLVAIFGNLFFIMAGFINPFIGITVAIVGIFLYISLGED